MDEDLGGIGRSGLPAETERGAGFGGIGEEGRLAPFQGFGERADAARSCGCIEDQGAQTGEAGARDGGHRVEHGLHGGGRGRRGEAAHDGKPLGDSGDRPSSLCIFFVSPAPTRR